MKRSRLFGTGLLLALTLGACDAAGTLGPTELPGADPWAGEHLDLFSAQVQSSEPRLAQGGPPNAGSLFEHLAAKIPGFLGLYRTGECQVAVVLTDMSQAKLAQQVVHAALAPIHPCHGLVQVDVVQGRPVRRAARLPGRAEGATRDGAQSGRDDRVSPEAAGRDGGIARSGVTR
jgi:hypothetical protein